MKPPASHRLRTSANPKCRCPRESGEPAPVSPARASSLQYEDGNRMMRQQIETISKGRLLKGRQQKIKHSPHLRSQRVAPPRPSPIQPEFPPLHQHTASSLLLVFAGITANWHYFALIEQSGMLTFDSVDGMGTRLADEVIPEVAWWQDMPLLRSTEKI